jgi:hypothetical protein
MSDPLPIVFIHLANSYYLPFTLGQAKMKNMNSPVIIIGDDTNNVFPFATHVHMNRYCKQAVEFQKIYKHYSPNGFIYEQFCFIRWFLLRDFMKAHGLTRVLHVDSDLMLYVDVNEEQKNWQDRELALVNGIGPWCMFINGTKVLDEFCDRIWEMYAAPGADERLAAMLEKERCPGRFAVSDMLPLREHYNANKSRMGEMTGIQPDGSFWDSNIRMDEGFEMLDGRKRYWLQDGRAYCRHVATGRNIWFKCLHFQGVAKTQIESAYRLGIQPPGSAAQAA